MRAEEREGYDNSDDDVDSDDDPSEQKCDLIGQNMGEKKKTVNNNVLLDNTRRKKEKKHETDYACEKKNQSRRA